MLHIWRFDPAEDEEPYYQEYTLGVPGGMTLLEALLRIQAEQDGTLTFRYSCRGAVCGSCAMVINGHVDLACRTQMHGLDSKVVIIEPLPNLPVLKDLVVDMDLFLEKVHTVQPWLRPVKPEPEREHLVALEQWAEAEPYANCILCACCHGVCPAASGTRSTWGRLPWLNTTASWPTSATLPTKRAWPLWTASRGCGAATWSGTVWKSTPRECLPPKALAGPAPASAGRSEHGQVKVCGLARCKSAKDEN